VPVLPAACPAPSALASQGNSYKARDSTSCIMTDPTQKSREDAPGDLRSKPPEFFNYFGRDRWIHLWLAEKRTRLIAALVPPFERLGLAPDTISYVGIALLTGVIIYFVRQPTVAVMFLAGHLLCDGLDGAFARHAGKASQSGAFTDLCCDQFGMVVVAMMAIFHHLVTPLLGTVYIALYLIVVVFGVIINVMGIGTRITITSKYFLYTVYAIWAFRGVNWFAPLMSFFSAIMAVEVLVGYLRLKRGLRRKYDALVPYTDGDSYSGRLNYVLNVSVPAGVLVAILIWGNIVPLRAMIDAPTRIVHWEEGPRIVPENEHLEILGFGMREGSFLVLTRDEDDGTLHIRKLSSREGQPKEAFSVPEYVDPAFSVFPVDGNLLLLADRTTRLLMGIDLDASFAAKQAVMTLTLPLGWLRVTAMGVGEWDGKRVWLVGNYLYTRRTYVVDPEEAVNKGFLLGGLEAAYINGGFPSGIAMIGDRVVEFNRSPLNGLLYVASLDRAIRGSTLLDVGKISFAPPQESAMGPVREGESLVMLSLEGRSYRLPFKDFLGK
jgi:phosphatidylglycerophosphate synthase